MRLSTLAFAVLLAAPSLASAQSWRIDPKPILDISSTSASGAVLFAAASSSARLSDGTIVIADRDDNVLHFFDAKGKPLRSAGHAGAGPGEFRSIVWFGRCAADSLLVWDMVQSRMSVFAPNGTFVRQFVPAADTRAAQPMMTVACSTNGSLVFQGQPKRITVPQGSRDNDSREGRVIHSNAPVSTADASGKIVRSLGVYPAGAMYAMGGGGFPLPLAATVYVATAGTRTFVGVSDSTDAINAYGATETPTVIHVTTTKRAVTAAQRERAVQALIAMAPAQVRTMAHDSLIVSPMPKMLPAYSGLFGDRDGVLWIQLTVPGDADTRLRAVGLKNETLGDVLLPANVVVHEIGRDYILGTVSDADDAPHVVMYRLHRGR